MSFGVRPWPNGSERVVWSVATLRSSAFSRPHADGGKMLNDIEVLAGVRNHTLAVVATVDGGRCVVGFTDDIDRARACRARHAADEAVIYRQTAGRWKVTA